MAGKLLLFPRCVGRQSSLRKAPDNEATRPTGVKDIYGGGSGGALNLKGTGTSNGANISLPSVLGDSGFASSFKLELRKTFLPRDGVAGDFTAGETHKLRKEGFFDSEGTLES
jgi:hypothetical protein